MQPMCAALTIRRRYRYSSRHRVRLGLMNLEDRTLPAVINWTLGAGGDFSNVSAWTVANTNPAQHRVPGPSDDAVIPAQYTVTSSLNQTVNSLSATNLRIFSGTFT